MSGVDVTHSDIRQHPRAPLTLEVRYRTTGSFLVSYSVNLSAGGIFLETQELLPLGTRLVVRFTVPGASRILETQATVVWVREDADAQLPRGLGVQFEHLEAEVGELIDQLVSTFSGMLIMLVTGHPSTNERLGRYLRSMLSCEVVALRPTELDHRPVESGTDLLLLDLNSTGPAGLRALAWAKGCTPVVPVVALAEDPEAAAAAKEAGAAAILADAPSFENVRGVVLEVLGRPSA